MKTQFWLMREDPEAAEYRRSATSVDPENRVNSEAIKRGLFDLVQTRVSGTPPNTSTLNVYAPAPDRNESAPATLASESQSSSGSSNPPLLPSANLPNGPGGPDGSGGSGGSTWIGRQAQAVYNALPTVQQANGLAEIAVGSVTQVGGTLATGAGIVVTGVGVLASETGVGIPVAGMGLGLTAGGLVTIQTGNTMVSQGQSDLNAPPPVGPTPMPAPSASVPPTNTAASSGISSEARVNIGNLAAMTGLDAGAILPNPGFTPAPPMPPLPGYTPVGDDQVNLGQIETFPIADRPAVSNTTGTPLPDINLGNWQESFPIAKSTIPTFLANQAANSDGSGLVPTAAAGGIDGDVVSAPNTVAKLEAGVPDVSSRPEWLQKLDAGNVFDDAQAVNYPNNEVYIDNAAGDGYTRLDSYNPELGKIISRKFTQLSDVQGSTAIGYVNELPTKYPVGATIADVPSSGSLAGSTLQGQYILKVPVQVKSVPQTVLNAANKAGVLIRDINGKIY